MPGLPGKSALFEIVSPVSVRERDIERVEIDGTGSVILNVKEKWRRGVMSLHKTSCPLCGRNCGLEVQVEDNQIVKVRPDKDNPKSEGYLCRKT